jgi:hypothetical protein
MNMTMNIGLPQNVGNFLGDEAKMADERLVELGSWYRAQKFIFFVEPQN